MASFRRGKWMSDQHDAHYGRGWKTHRLLWWSATRRFKNAVRARASRSLDVYQFGVYTGGSMAGIARNIPGFGTLWGFDSFTGLPAETPGQALEGAHWRPGGFSSADALGEYRRDELFSRLRRTIARRDGNVSFVPGYYNESLTTSLLRERAFQPALLIDVDVDLHSSTVDCLSWLIESRLLVPATFVRYDDWRRERQNWGEGRAHADVSRRYNLTWQRISQKEFQLLAVGDAGPRAPIPLIPYIK